jgi:hypothetical protein
MVITGTAATADMVEDPLEASQSRLDIETAWSGEPTMLATTGHSICTTRVALDPGTTITVLSMATRKFTGLPIVRDSVEATSRVIVSMAAATTGGRDKACRG